MIKEEDLVCSFAPKDSDSPNIFLLHGWLRMDLAIIGHSLAPTSRLMFFPRSAYSRPNC
jgi:hypothetical protein